MPDEKLVRDIRDFRITDANFEEFGFTQGCLGCDAKRHGKGKRAHSQQCRTRIEAGIKAKDPDDPVLQRREDRHVAWSEEVARAAGPKGDPEREEAPQVPEANVEPSRAAEQPVEDSEADEDEIPSLVDESDSEMDVDQQYEPASPGTMDDAENSNEHPAEKRRRMGMLESTATFYPEVSQTLAQLCKGKIKMFVEELDKKYTKKVQRDLRRT